MLVGAGGYGRWAGGGGKLSVVVGLVCVGVYVYVMRCASDRGSFEVLGWGESFGE